jgi:hypothetical protein
MKDWRAGASLSRRPAAIIPPADRAVKAGAYCDAVPHSRPFHAMPSLPRSGHRDTWLRRAAHDDRRVRMKRWYSARGARRGVKWSAIAAACWLCWAAGYRQAPRPHPVMAFSQVAASTCHHADGH